MVLSSGRPVRRRKIASFDVSAVNARECAQLLAEYLDAARAQRLDGVLLGVWLRGDPDMYGMVAGRARRHPEDARDGARRIVDVLSEVED